MSKRYSDVVESRVERAILDAESRKNAASTSDSKQPRRTSRSGRRADLTMLARCAEPPSYRRRGRLVKRSPQQKLNPGDWSDRREQKEVIDVREMEAADWTRSSGTIKRRRRNTFPCRG
jgi:hypothetical protein